jgi:hypothetical protein
LQNGENIITQHIFCGERCLLGKHLVQKPGSMAHYDNCCLWQHEVARNDYKETTARFTSDDTRGHQENIKKAAACLKDYHAVQYIATTYAYADGSKVN